MDFFGIIYDIKNGKKIPYSKTYFDTLFAAKLEELSVKTITGTLPLTFTTSETALRSWTIYGNNTPHNYSATGTLPLAVTTHTAGAANDWAIFGNDDNGTEQLFDRTQSAQGLVTADGSIHPGTVYYSSDYIKITSNQDYCVKVNSIWDAGARIIPVAFYDDSKQFISYTQSEAFRDETKSFVTTSPSNAAYLRFSYVNYQDKSDEDVMLVKGSTAPDHYIPYQQGVGEQRVDGYYVPLTVSQTGQTDKNYDIFIGDSPLTEGETVSKTSTGIDIELFEGANTISTTLYNKPSMSITGVDYVGVGEPTNDGWQIPLTVSDGTNTTTVNVPIDAPLIEGQTVSKESTGVDIETFPNVVNSLRYTTDYDNFEMTIKYKE